MRIGINLLHLLPGGIFGSETYIRNLLSGLASIDTSHEYVLFTNTDNHDSLRLSGGNFQRVLCPLAARPQIRRVVYEQAILPLLATRHRLDVLHSPGYTAPLNVPCANVVSILDMLYRVYPRIIPQPKRSFWQVSIPLSARRCHAVLTISENSGRDIVKYLHIPAEKIVVSHLAVDQQLVDSYRGLQSEQARNDKVGGLIEKGPYVFTLINSINGHKNLLGLLMAFKELHRRLPDTRLVVGGRAGEEAKTQRVLEALGLREAVLLPGYLTAEDIVRLYIRAAAYVIPSLFEGFGLPALEAMYFGVPVVCSNAGSLPEVVGDAGIFFDPKDHSKMSECLYRVLTDGTLRSELIQKGRNRVSGFTWQETARKTLLAYELAVRRWKLSN
jgi:glycosyltransferase involved in cell wall biosynthesis